MNIREATQDDLFDILVLGRDFSRQAGHLHRFEKQKTAEVMAGLIESEQGCVFVLEDDGFIIGGIVGLVNQMPFGIHPVATELAWFLDEKYRGNKKSLLLVQAFEEWAKSVGAEYVIMAHIHTINNLDKVYTKLGYTPAETAYAKRIE
jgi:GNAT superfamily N-acetyltransferase